MNNNILLAYFINILPKLTLAFVGFLLLYKFYFKIRSKYSVKVNCWFCNSNSKVPYSEANSWTCTRCEQYNGFNKDGDYNREIKEQFECNLSSETHTWFSANSTQNGFCDACNEAQRLKIEKLSQFQPKKESSFDAELKIYKAQLEEQYRLCATCERHLKTVLRNKKKMVLGSKFLEYILKSAEVIKDPHLVKIRLAQQLLWKRRLTFLITLLTFINLCCLAGLLPSLNRAWFMHIFGDMLGSQIFIACSHFNACWRVLLSFFNGLMENETVIRFGLFVRTIFMMLLYSLGLRLPQLVRLNFISLYLLSAPFFILATIFSYNVIDRFKLTRYTALLVLWSIYAGGLLEHNINSIQQVLMFAASILTTFLTCTNKVETSPKLFDTSANSFHKLFADDYASDLDTATSSVLSYPLDSSSLSTQSDISHSFATLKRASLKPFNKTTSPLSSSTLSLNLTPRSTLRSNLLTFEKKSPLTSSTYSLNQTSRLIRGYPQNAVINNSYSSSANERTLRPHTSNSNLNSTFIVHNAFDDSNGKPTKADQLNSAFLNNSFLNNSFSGNRIHTPSFERPGFNNLTRQQTFMPASAIQSGFSASTTALHNIERPSRVLSPSRLSFNTSSVGFANTSNRFANSVNILEQCKSPAALSNIRPHSTFSSSTLYPISEALSRASSRSSGFESQNDHLNNSRENSYGVLETDLQNKTSLLDTSSQGFQPLTFNQLNNGIDNTFSLLSLQQPLSVDCNSTYQSNSHTNLFSSPSIRRGDLLRKWKDGVVMT